MQQLFSPNLMVRFAATEQFQASNQVIESTLWPRACWGAANAWIILVGPSPGRPAEAQNPWPGGPDRPRDSRPHIGLSAGIIDFRDGANRNRRWMSLVDDFTGDAKYSAALAAVCNLDWQEQSDQSLIPDEFLRIGCRHVDEVLRSAKPRIVAAMTVRTWDHLCNYYRSQHAVEDFPVDGLKRGLLKAALFDEFETFLIKVRHPSHPIPRSERAVYRDLATQIRNSC